MNTRVWRWMTATGLAIASVGVPVAARADETPRAEGEARLNIEAMLVAFAEATKTKDADAIATAIETLAAAAHADVVKPIARYVGHANEPLAITAAKALGRVGKALPEKSRVGALSALTPVLRVAAARPALVIAACDALGAMGDLRAAPALLPLVESKDNLVAKAAIAAFATVRTTAAIEPIVDELAKIESAPKGRGDSSASGGSSDGWGGKGGVSEKLAARITAIREPGLASLRAITGQRFESVLEWRRWWKANKGTFKVAAAADAPAAAK